MVDDGVVVVDGWIFDGSEMKQEERFQNSLIDDVAVAMTCMQEAAIKRSQYNPQRR